MVRGGTRGSNRIQIGYGRQSMGVICVEEFVELYLHQRDLIFLYQVHFKRDYEDNIFDISSCFCNIYIASVRI